MWLSALFGAIGSGIQGFFGMRKEQGELVRTAIQTLGDINASEGQREQAIATIIASEFQSGNWLAQAWRPITMLVFLGLVVSFWFGYVPPHMFNTMPPALVEVFGLIKLGLGGYIGSRGIEKIATSISLSSVMKEFIKKKL